MSDETFEYNRHWYKYRHWPRWKSWFSAPPPVAVFVPIAVCVVADWIGCYVGCSRLDRLPYAGWALELSGVFLVVKGVSDRLLLHGALGLATHIWREIKEWALSIPVLKKHVRAQVSLGATAQMVAEGSLDARDWKSLASVEERLERLEHMVRDEIPKKIDELHKEVRQEAAKLRKEVRSQAEAVRKELGEVRKVTRDTAVGDASWELVGAIWIAFGVTLATVPGLLLVAFGWLVEILTVSAFSCRPHM